MFTFLNARSIHHTKMSFVTCCAVEEWGHNGVKCLGEYMAPWAFYVSKAMACSVTYGIELQLTNVFHKEGKINAKNRMHREVWINDQDGRCFRMSISTVNMVTWLLTSVSGAFTKLSENRKQVKRLGGATFLRSVLESRIAHTARDVSSCWLSTSTSSSISIATHLFSFTAPNIWYRVFCVTLITSSMSAWVCECVVLLH